MIVAALQMSSQRDVEQNLRDAETLIAEAVERRASLVVLPENFSFLGAEDSERAAVAEHMGDGPSQAFLAEQASRYGLWLVGGTIPIWDGEEQPRSRSLLVAPDGSVAAHYDKLHLFDVIIPDNEQESYRESERTAPGDAPTIAETPFGRIGMTVCYDLRFPALFHRLSVLGMDILVVPAAFTVPTGRVHWEPLLRTRAFEALCYVVASGQWGRHAGGRLTYGHSSIVSPWGELVASLDSGTGVVSAELDFESLRSLRTKFPVLQHRREF